MPQDNLVAHLRRTTQGLNHSRAVRDPQDMLARIVRSATAAVPGTHVAGVTLADECYLALDAGTSTFGKLDVLQRELGEGPATTVLAEPPADGTVVAEDFAGHDAERWPAFSEHALEAGYRSMVSVLLEVAGFRRGTLNLYGVRAYAFDGEARHAAGLFGMNVGMLLLAAEQADHLQRAVDSRDLIGRAKGMLMERFGLDESAAFARLVQVSQETNVKIVGVAQYLSDHAGAVDGRAHRPIAVPDGGA